jgi:hypothetical protein
MVIKNDEEIFLRICIVHLFLRPTILADWITYIERCLLNGKIPYGNMCTAKYEATRNTNSTLGRKKGFMTFVAIKWDGCFWLQNEILFFGNSGKKMYIKSAL